MKNVISRKIDKNNLIGIVRNYGLVLIGALVLSLGYSLFIVPHKLVPGGVFGLSIVAFEVINISIGTIALIINIPLLIWGTKVLGKTTVLKTAVFMIASSFFLDSIGLITQKAIIIDDILVSGIFGGLLVGSSIFIVKSGGATTGGSDIVARILVNKVNLQFNQLLLLMDAVVILLGIITFKDYTMAAYCLITIITTSKTIGHYAKQNEQSKTVLIFSEDNSIIQKAICEDEKMKEDIIKLIHNNADDKLVLVAKNGKRLKGVEQFVYQTDPKAHIVMI
ncbi:MAG: YitT family protein [Vicingaceae bacterium]